MGMLLICKTRRGVCAILEACCSRSWGFRPRKEREAPLRAEVFKGLFDPVIAARHGGYGLTAKYATFASAPLGCGRGSVKMKSKIESK